MFGKKWRKLEMKELDDFSQPVLIRRFNEAGRPECFNRADHYENLIIWGHCPRCLRAFSL